MGKMKLVVSDFHLSSGRWLSDGRRNPLEDFHQDERFREFLEHYSSGAHENYDVELVINGDFFDPLAVLPPGVSLKGLRKLQYPLDVEESPAVDQIRRILDGHPITVRALHDFMKRGKTVTIRWGNHDASLLWEGVQTLIRERLAPSRPELLRFQIEPYLFDRIRIDHGHQYEAINNFDPNRLFIERPTPTGTKRILSLPFGSFFVLGFINRIKLERHFINQVQPFRTYLRWAMVFEPLFFVTGGVRAAWFFFKMRFVTHPMRFARFRKTLKILGEFINRPSLEEEAERELKGDESGRCDFDVLIMGHNHQAAFRIFPNGRQYINTGTWIPLTSLDMATLGHRVLRTYARIDYVGGKAQASLRIWHGTPQASEEYA
jgi:UDP-2,3-diacylglucosamine pyrophosphatase LpxH